MLNIKLLANVEILPVLYNRLSALKEFLRLASVFYGYLNFN